MEIVAAEDKAEAEAEKIYPLNPSDPNYPYDNYKEQAIKHYDRSGELKKKYRGQVLSKHGITEEIRFEISGEARQESWPMPQVP